MRYLVVMHGRFWTPTWIRMRNRRMNVILYKEIKSDSIVAERSIVILALAANHAFQEISLLQSCISPTPLWRTTSEINCCVFVNG